MNIVTATVAGQSFEFTAMDDDGYVLVVRRAHMPTGAQWHDAFPYFSVNFEDDQYTVEELHTIMDKVTKPIYLIRETNGNYTEREPTVGKWYAGNMLEEGYDFLAEYIGNGEFQDDDGTERDMNGYAHLAEQY